VRVVAGGKQSKSAKISCNGISLLSTFFMMSWSARKVCLAAIVVKDLCHSEYRTVHRLHINHKAYRDSIWRVMAVLYMVDEANVELGVRIDVPIQLLLKSYWQAGQDQHLAAPNITSHRFTLQKHKLTLINMCKYELYSKSLQGLGLASDYASLRLFYWLTDLKWTAKWNLVSQV